MPTLFPFPHNWSASMKVDVSYKTEIIQSRVMREQRLALRSQPRKQMTLSVSPSGADLRLFLAQMAAQQQTEWIVIETTRAAPLAADLAPGGLSFEFGLTAPAWAVAGAYCGFEVGKSKVTCQIVGVSGGTVSFSILSGTFTTTIPTGTLVYPGLVGRLSTSIRGNLLTNAVGTFTVVFEADPGINRVETDVAAPATFNGKELFLLKPNWQGAPQVTLESMLETIDYDRGRLVHNQPVVWNVETLRLEYLRRNRDEAEALTQFFHRMRGQQGEFYMPTWVNDFDISTGAAAGTTGLTVPGRTIYDLFAGSPVYKSVIVFYRDGSYHVNRVNGITLTSGDSRLAFASLIPQAISKNTVKLMCWLPAWRLAIDTLSLEWLTRSVAQTQLTMRTIEDLA